MNPTYSDVLAILLSDSSALDLADEWLILLSDDCYSVLPRVTA